MCEWVRKRVSDGSYIGLVLLQDAVSGKLGLRHAGELADDEQEGLQASQPELLTVVCGRHEGHADQVCQVQHQEVCQREHKRP